MRVRLLTIVVASALALAAGGLSAGSARAAALPSNFQERTVFSGLTNPTAVRFAADGRRYSWGYPACPEQSEHEKVYRLLDAPAIGLSLTGGYAVEPEQSTLAIIAHHPQAVYFGMKSGFLPKGKVPDDVIAGSDRDATYKRDNDPRDGPPEDEPALAADARA